MDRQQIFDYAKKKYKTTPEYLWARCPSYAVLRQSPGFLPGYHMNKTNWLSILLDGTVSDEQILDLLDLSFQMTAKKKTVTCSSLFLR